MTLFYIHTNCINKVYSLVVHLLLFLVCKKSNNKFHIHTGFLDVLILCVPLENASFSLYNRIVHIIVYHNQLLLIICLKLLPSPGTPKHLLAQSCKCNENQNPSSEEQVDDIVRRYLKYLKLMKDLFCPRATIVHHVVNLSYKRVILLI